MAFQSKPSSKPKYEGNLQRRFITLVLVPPFIALLLLSSVVYWQLDKLLRDQAIGELRRSATATAAKLDREFALRESVLKRTGEELFAIKRDYRSSRQKLDENREACRAHVRQKSNFQGAPEDVCEPFLNANAPRLQAIEDEYIKQGQQLDETQNQRVNDRLTAFKQFFPETLALMVLDDKKQVVSSALSNALESSVDAFKPDAATALNTRVQGKPVKAEGFELSVFAFPITGGSVLAAYDLNHQNFIRQTWESAPIDKTKMLTIILDSSGQVAYPDLANGDNISQQNASLRSKDYVDIKLENVRNVAVGVEAGISKWLAVVASPRAAVLGPLRDAQLAGILIIGVLIAGFLWVGTYFIQRIVRNIVLLVSGALVFGSGRLDHQITLPHADREMVQLAETMNSMAQRIATAEKAIDEKNKEFISIATHELRAPLTVIIGRLSIFKEKYYKKLSKDARSHIDEAHYGTVRMRDLVNDMLNVARLESGKTETATASLPIEKIIHENVANMGVVAKISKVKLVYSDAHARNVMADEGRLKIIINNLVSNAIKYNKPGGKVHISHKVDGNFLVTAVADTGLGIPDDQKDYMFQKFFRVKNEDRQNITGTGLGMYITNQYIQEMQGRLWFESTFGKGTTFYFTLPVADTKHHQK